MQHSRPKHPAAAAAYRFAFIMVGAVIAAAGIEEFLVPNHMIDGGVVGVSIMISLLTPIPLGLLVAVINAPFLYLGYKYIGKTFVAASIFGIVAFSLWVEFFHPITAITHDILLAALFGGLLVGTGVGIIIRFGGSLDGTEMVAIILSKRASFTVGQFVMLFNLFIMGVAALLFGWDRAMYSLLAYFIAFKVIDIVVEGIDESKAAMIVSPEWEEIARAIEDRLGRSVTYLYGEGGFSGQQTRVVYAVVTRLEVAKLKAVVADKDPGAFVTIHNVYDVMSRNYKKRSIH